MKPRIALPLIAGLLLLAGLACQTGEVLTPEEATARARESRSVQTGITSVPSANDTTPTPGGLTPGTAAELTDRSFMVNLYSEPGGTRIIAQQESGAEVTIEDTTTVDGNDWVLVTAPTGLGWVKEENVKVTESETEEEGSATTEGIQVGDIVYLTNRGFMVNLYGEPGSLRMIAQQERNVQVTIIEITELDGELWYLVDAPTGLGWVPAENISIEEP